MSYILDALRKADAERARERQAVPDLNAQTLPLSSLEGPGAARTAAPWGWLAAGAVLALLLVMGLRGFGGGEASPPAPQVAATPPTTLPPATPAPSAPSALPAPPTPKPKPKPQLVARPAPPPPAVTPSAPSRSPSPRRLAQPAAASQVAERIPRLDEWTAEDRRALPALAIGGVVGSPDPAQRMLIVNGQVLREGDTLAPGLTLERIGPKAAVFSSAGRRFEIPI